MHENKALEFLYKMEPVFFLYPFYSDSYSLFISALYIFL